MKKNSNINHKLFKLKIAVTSFAILLIAIYIFVFIPPHFLMNLSFKLRRNVIDEFLSSYKINESVYNYKLIIDKQNYTVYKRPKLGDKIVAVLDDMSVLLKENGNNQELLIYDNYSNMLFNHPVSFNNNNFPGLLSGSKISYCMLLPYTRNTNGSTLVKSKRLVVITDKGQVFHNYPARNRDFDGVEKDEDIVNFEESAIWDLPGRKYPTLDENVNNTERYFPFLPKENYEYHPILNSSKYYKDRYGNGGFGKTTYVTYENKKVEVSRFYMPNRNNEQANSFLPMSGYEPDGKLTLLGTYRSNTDTGVRIVIFASSDGGRNWFCKYEFGDLGEYEFQQGIGKNWGHNFGNDINTTMVSDEYIQDSLSIRKRNVITPSANEKYPDSKFIWDNAIKISILEKGERTKITTQSKHNLKTGNIIAIQNTNLNIPTTKFWKLLTNDAINNVSSGNGLLFKVEVIDEYSFILYEFVSSPENNITCRHIHHINRVKDGFIIGTGEVYPNGWLLYMQMKESDTFNLKSATDEFKIVRLNSSQNSVQRTLGLILFDDKDQTIMFASDADTISRDEFLLPNGKDKISRSSTGIYKGKLSDIDDYNKFNLIQETKETAYFFKKLGNALVFSGQRGELSISFNNGTTWNEESLEEPLIHYYGKTYTYYVIDDYIIKFK